MAVKLSRNNWRLVENWQGKHAPALRDWLLDALDEAGIDVDEVIDQFRAQRALQGENDLNDIEQAVIDAGSGGTRKIEAIKRYRELTGSNLVEAKDFVENLFGRFYSD